MFEALICFFAIILILCGLFFVFYLLISKALSCSAEGFFAAVEGFEENENLACEVYSAFIQINMMNFTKKRDVYVIDYDLSQSTKEHLVTSMTPYGKIVFLKIENNRLVRQ